MLTGKTLAAALAEQPGIMDGLNESQLATLQEYVRERLPAAIDSYLDQPLTLATCCQVTAACLRDMTSQGTMIKLMIDAPCCCCAGGLTPELCQVINSNSAQQADRVEQMAGMDDRSDPAQRLLDFGLRPELVQRAAVGQLTVAQALAAQPYVFLHPHRDLG